MTRDELSHRENERKKKMTDTNKSMKDSRTRERKMIDIDRKYESKSEKSKGAHVDRNQGKAVITGFHNETSEPEVTQLLKESKTEIGKTMENVRIECPAKLTHFKNDEERNKFVRSSEHAKKELRGRKLKNITISGLQSYERLSSTSRMVTRETNTVRSARHVDTTVERKEVKDISIELDTDESISLKKRMVSVKYCLHEIVNIPLAARNNNEL